MVLSVDSAHHQAMSSNPQSPPMLLQISSAMQHPPAQQNVRRPTVEYITGGPIVRLPSIDCRGVILESGPPAFPSLGHTASAPELEHEQPLQALEGSDSRKRWHDRWAALQLECSDTTHSAPNSQAITRHHSATSYLLNCPGSDLLQRNSGPSVRSERLS